MFMSPEVQEDEPPSKTVLMFGSHCLLKAEYHPNSVGDTDNVCVWMDGSRLCCTRDSPVVIPTERAEICVCVC